MSTKHGQGAHSKIVFTQSPQQTQAKINTYSQNNSKKVSPDNSTNAYLKVGEKTDPQKSIMNLLKRR